jgi:hypothetical protein
VGKVDTFMVGGKYSNQLRTSSYKSTPRTTCAATCLVWNDLLNKLVNMGVCLAGGADDRLSVSLWASARCNWGRLSVALRPIVVRQE